ncbi:MAG: hypothetical protein K6F80_00630 [Oscillospiraceae bacterium]|nr:hypothetical protein [Oscillospiraceae bacterium]
MSIVSNINDAGIAETNRFIPIYPNKDQYYSALRTHFGDSFDTGGSDHFVSSMTDINTISDIYDLSKLNGGTGTDAALEQIRQKIHSKSNLYRWFSAVVCALIYGCDGTNQLSVANIPFDGGTNAYLNIWKDKFNRIGANGNHNDNPDFDSDTNRNGYNILQFGTGYEQMIGSFSTEYFVIPLREMNLTGKTVNAWKEKYNFLCDANHSVHLLDQLNSLLNIRQKVLLKLSAMSIGANASKPMLLFKDLVLKYVDTNGIPLNPGIVHYNTINGIKLYKIQNTVNLDRMIAENLYVGYHNAHDSCRFYALYPFTDEMIGALNHNRCTVSDIQLNIEKDPNSPQRSSVQVCNSAILPPSILLQIPQLPQQRVLSRNCRSIFRTSGNIFHRNISRECSSCTPSVCTRIFRLIMKQSAAAMCTFSTKIR